MDGTTADAIFYSTAFLFPRSPINVPVTQSGINLMLEITELPVLPLYGSTLNSISETTVLPPQKTTQQSLLKRSFK